MTIPEPRPRPMLQMSRSPLSVALEVMAVVGIVVSVAIVVQAWDRLPDRLPIHFGLSGRPDGWAGKWAIGLLPVVGVVLMGLLGGVDRFPQTWNYPVAITEENAGVQYQLARSLLLWMKVELIWLFVLILWQQVQVALGNLEAMNTGLVLGGLMVVFGTVGVYLRKAFLAR